MLELDQHLGQVAMLLARIFLGLLFIWQGYDKIFKLGISKVEETFRYELQGKGVPSALFPLTAFFSSWTEFLGGILLLFGFFKSIGCLLLGLDLILVISAMSMINPIWDMKFVFPRVALLLFVMLIPAAKDFFSLDYFLFYR
jgi:putative oxidoreductase